MMLLIVWIKFYISERYEAFLGANSTQLSISHTTLILPKLSNEQQELNKYSAALSTNMGGHERARIQKAVKYRKHMVEGC